AAGMQGGNLQALLAKLPVRTRQRVLSVGHLSDGKLLAAIQGASVLAYPSRFEGFGLPPLEALRAGGPVVASDTPAVREACGDAALYAAADSPREWSASLHKVLTDQFTSGCMQATGKRRSAEFTWHRCAEQTLDLYDKMC